MNPPLQDKSDIVDYEYKDSNRSAKSSFANCIFTIIKTNVPRNGRTK